MSSPQPEMESEQSDLEMSDTDSLAKELRGVVMEEEEEKEETMKNTVLLIEHTDDNPEPGNTKISEMDLVVFNTQKALTEAQLKKEKSEILKTQKAVTGKNEFIKMLACMYEAEVCSHEEFIMDFEKKSADKNYAEATKAKEELDAVIEKLTDGTLESEFAEGVLNKYKSYKNLLFNLLLLQEAETSKAKVLINKDDQNEMKSEPQKRVVRKGSERDLESSLGQVLPSTKDPTLSSAYSDTVVPDSTLDVNSTEYEEYFSNPQQLVGLLSDLTDLNLSQNQNSTGEDNILEQTTELASEKMKELEERLPSLVCNMKDRIVKEQERAVMLGKQVQLHEAVKIQDRDILDAVDKKVTEVHLCFVDCWMTDLSITEKLCNAEHRMSLMLQQIESIPEDTFKTLQHINNTEWRNSCSTMDDA
ncbi:GRIP and coiled-coil domain-containing protein 2-like isoform X2 [Amphiprion ocellaris]|uniref:GRIP and coiled-coil domain-containing protein 2-like isoform X2 n=1 Tax=Amphiprion ocellaris TaxID=80972 RepID=UPI002410DF72|nr:GRIP and coiled-coil domain-containing protein 2-like isoform X2 [Amphiprion ocellaris]